MLRPFRKQLDLDKPIVRIIPVLMVDYMRELKAEHRFKTVSAEVMALVAKEIIDESRIRKEAAVNQWENPEICYTAKELDTMFQPVGAKSVLRTLQFLGKLGLIEFRKEGRTKGTKYYVRLVGEWPVLAKYDSGDVRIYRSDVAEILKQYADKLKLNLDIFNLTMVFCQMVYLGGGKEIKDVFEYEKQLREIQYKLRVAKGEKKETLLRKLDWLNRAYKIKRLEDIKLKDITITYDQLQSYFPWLHKFAIGRYLRFFRKAGIFRVKKTKLDAVRVLITYIFTKTKKVYNAVVERAKRLWKGLTRSWHIIDNKNKVGSLCAEGVGVCDDPPDDSEVDYNIWRNAK